MPQTSLAYKTVSDSSMQINDTTYLLTHTYTMGFLNISAQTPIVASFDDSSMSTYPRVLFTIKGVEQELSGNVSVDSLVLSDAEINNSQYKMQPGKRNTFTLFALVTLQEPVDDISKLSLVIQELPYSFARDSEMKTYLYELAN